MKGTRGPINQGSFNSAAGTPARTHKAAHRENSLKKNVYERGEDRGEGGKEGEGGGGRERDYESMPIYWFTLQVLATAPG